MKTSKQWLQCAASVFALAALTFSFSASADNYYGRKAIKVFAGKQMVLKIEHSESESGQAYPRQGAIVQRYSRDGSYESQSYGEAESIESIGEYKLRRRHAVVTEKLEDANGESVSTRYAFESFNRGTFERSMHDGLTTIRGSFNLSKQRESNMLAPENHNGITVALSIFETESALPPELYPRQGVVLQSYEADGTYVGKGFGPGTIDHHGPYEFERIAPNVAVEKTVQIAEGFTFPFTMVYTYETPRSGTWYQDFGNGLILFSGTFTTFETR